MMRDDRLRDDERRPVGRAGRGQVSVPVLHSSAALLKLSLMRYTGAQSIFMRASAPYHGRHDACFPSPSPCGRVHASWASDAWTCSDVLVMYS
jgi:hypothetical protein